MIFRSPWPPLEGPSSTVCDEVLGKAGVWGDKPAVIEGETGRTLTYRQLVRDAERMAAGLARAGLRPGQAVAVALPNSIDFVLTWFGALRAGGWVVPINPLYTHGEMEHQIRDSGAGLLVALPETAAALSSVVDRAIAVDDGRNELLECEDAAPDVCAAPGDLAALLYSSGTTGKPKGVMLTHGNIACNMRQIYAADGVRSDDLLVNMMPLYHAAGLTYALNTFAGIGATVVLMRRFDLEKWLGWNERYRATVTGGPPPVILAATKSPLWERFRLDRIEQAMCGAAPLGSDLQEAFEQRTGVVLRQIWGMTEGTCVIAMDSRERAKRKLGSCGPLLPSTEARVMDVVSQGELGVGEVGEIWVRGPNMMGGYWRQPAATAETLVDGGWMRTGDLGYFDADGCVFLVDRLKELIKYNALQVAPAELEDILQSHPSVMDAAVVGAPHESLGEIPMAFVVRRAGAMLGAEELMQYVAARVAPHKKVRAVEFVEQIPKSPTGKILRRVLRERVRAERA